MTLHKQLTRSHILVALAGLLLASLVGALLLRNEQVRAAERSVALITNIVAARIRSDALRPDDPQLERIVEAAGGRVLLVNAPDGTVLSDSTEGDNSLAGEQLPVRALLAAAREAQRPAIRQARFRGDTYYLSIVPVRPLSERDRLVIAIPTATVLESWMGLLPGMLLMGGMGGVIAWLFASRLSFRVTEPLAALDKAAARMAEGDYDARVATVSDIRELQALSKTFNSMADEIQSARQVQRDFLANVSHDLRTPLTSIQGFSQAIMDGTVPDDQQQRVATIIYTEAGRLGRLVLDLLDLARIEAGRFSMNRRDLHLNQVLNQVHEAFAPQAERAGVSLSMKLPSRALPLFADGDRLAQVFGNLVDNAITYAQQGDKSVHISATLGGVRDLRTYAPAPGTITPAGLQNGPGELGTKATSSERVPALSQAASGRNGRKPAAMTQSSQSTTGALATPEPETKLGRWWVEVTITDGGPGIALDQQARVFERFHRGDAARSGGGMGLGLAIAREIVEAHGGDITVRDDDGMGTRFTVRLPMKMW